MAITQDCGTHSKLNFVFTSISNMTTFFQILWLALKTIRYEIVYYLLGAVSVYEDIVYKKRNRCDLVIKTGEVAVITGGARGLGAHVVKRLLECDMHVILGCRNVSAGNEMVRKLKDSGILSGTCSVLHLDMTSLDSIRNFASSVLNETQRLDVLINNAGIMFPPYNETENGFESQWGVNYVGHFLLTHLLMNRLNETGRMSDVNTRVVNVSSCAHFASYPIDFNNINMKNEYIPSAGYAQSKLAQLMFTKTLDRHLVDMGLNVRTLAVHPGVVDTDIFDGTLVKKIFPWAMKLLFKTPDEGATSIVYASISPRLNDKGGLYISNCRDSAVSKLSQDPLQQDQLFSYTLSSLNLKQFFIPTN